MNTFLSSVENIANKTKYLTWYQQICIRAIERASNKTLAKQLLGDIEAHHIFPRCMSHSNSSENYVYLTPKEHFVAHWLLSKMFSGKAKSQMKAAITRFTQNASGKRILNGNEYAAVRRATSEWERTADIKESMSKKALLRQTNFSEEEKKDIAGKISVANKGQRWITDGVNDLRVRAAAQIPEGWTLGRSTLPKEWSETRKSKREQQDRSLTKEERSKKYSSANNRSPEVLAQWQQQMRGRKWMNNGIRSSNTHPDQFQPRLADGWTFGRLKAYVKE